MKSWDPGHSHHPRKIHTNRILWCPATFPWEHFLLRVQSQHQYQVRWPNFENSHDSRQTMHRQSNGSIYLADFIGRFFSGEFGLLRGIGWLFFQKIRGNKGSSYRRWDDQGAPNSSSKSSRPIQGGPLWEMEWHGVPINGRKEKGNWGVKLDLFTSLRPVEMSFSTAKTSRGLILLSQGRSNVSTSLCIWNEGTRKKKKQSFRFIVECGTGCQQGGPLPDKSRRP